jgi:hypothetical protein
MEIEGEREFVRRATVEDRAGVIMMRVRSALEMLPRGDLVVLLLVREGGEIPPEIFRSFVEACCCFVISATRSSLSCMLRAFLRIVACILILHGIRSKATVHELPT